MLYYHYLYKAADSNFYKESATSIKSMNEFLADWKSEEYKKNFKLLKVWKIDFEKRKFIEHEIKNEMRS